MAQEHFAHARINQTSGIPEHRHDGLGWHWASVQHSDAAGTGGRADTTDPVWDSPPSPDQRALYQDLLRRRIAFRLH